MSMQINSGAGDVARPGMNGERAHLVSFWAFPGDDRAVIVIDRPGVYVLVQNIMGMHGKSGIRIEADGVELHLGGFEIAGCDGSRDGITVVHEGARIAVHGGVIRGWGGAGIDARSARRCELDELAIKDNAGEAIVTTGETLVRNCRLFGNGRRATRTFWRLAL